MCGQGRAESDDEGEELYKPPEVGSSGSGSDINGSMEWDLEEGEEDEDPPPEGVVGTNGDYSLGEGEALSDPHADGLPGYEGVVLTALTYIPPRVSVGQLGGFSEEQPPACLRCLRWMVTAPFSRCNRRGLGTCSRCTEQHTSYTDVSRFWRRAHTGKHGITVHCGAKSMLCR